MRRRLTGLAVLIILAAACSASQTLSCPQPAAGACPSLDGVTSFCTWAEWGCATEAACGGYFALRDEAVDARLSYYYAVATGQFVATVKEAPSGGNATCVAGPASFQVPPGCALDTLADCAPPPRDVGVVVGARDASADGAFVPPAPSGSPSAGPLRMPPVR